MITVTQTRDKDGMHFEDPPRTFTDSLEALGHLARVELAWGAHIVDLSESRIKLETEVMGCLDTSIFEGSVEAMKPLFELTYFYVEASRKHGDVIIEETASCTQRIPGGNVPLLLTMMAPMLIGGNRLKVAVMLACGVQDEDDIKTGLSAKVEDLVAAAQLSKGGLCSFREALSI